VAASTVAPGITTVAMGAVIAGATTAAVIVAGTMAIMAVGFTAAASDGVRPTGSRADRAGLFRANAC